MIGQTISHYVIVEKLGEGGMGVVYKAHDTDLDRDVALNFRPAQFSASEAERARFVQEAKAAASLNHPNICTIFGIEEFNPAPSGAEGGKQMFFAMSFVDGTTLREKIPSLSQKQAIDIAIQAADGLSAAHEKGIVHRDIKPENVMIRRDGIVQVMDFGLARLRESSSRINRLTMAGSTVGTAGYMSPEQIQGQDADHRSDIFSLGVLLYEMLAGQLPFKGVHQTALAYEIVNVDPPPPSAVKPGIDPALDALVLECLAKEPAERFQSVAELGKELRRYKRESGRSRVSTVSRVGSFAAAPAATAASVAGGTAAGPATSGRGAGRERIAWAGALLLAIAAIGYFLIMKPGRPETGPLSVRFTITPPPNTVIENTAISPDGRTIAFTATGEGRTRLWIRPMRGLEAQPLPGTENAAYPFWSPDSRFIGFFADRKLNKIDIAGGSPLFVCEVYGPYGGSWSARGDIIFSRGAAGIFLVPAAGGNPRLVIAPDTAYREEALWWPAFLDDGDRILFTSLGVFDDKVKTYSMSIGDTARTHLLTSDANAVYAAPDRLLFLNNRTLMSQKIDAGATRLVGDPSPVTVDVGMTPRNALGDYGYSAAGVLATGTGRSIYRQYTWFDRSGKALGTACPPGNYFDIDLSPDGTRAAVQRSDIQTGNSDIWLIDLTRSLISRFTFDAGVDDDPTWSPDGKYVYFSNTASGRYVVQRKASSGVGAPELIHDMGKSQMPSDWSPDGKHLLMNVTSPQGETDLWVTNEGGNPPSAPYLATSFDEYGAQFSPDGRWVAYTSNESGRPEIYVQSFPAGDGRWQVSLEGGARPRWNPKGGELLFLSPNLEMMSVEVRPGPTFDYGTPKALFVTRIDNYSAPNRYAVSADGSRFLINVAVDEQKANVVTVSINPF